MQYNVVATGIGTAGGVEKPIEIVHFHIGVESPGRRGIGEGPLHVKREISGVDIIEGNRHIANLHLISKRQYVGVIAGYVESGSVCGGGGVWQSVEYRGDGAVFTPSRSRSSCRVHTEHGGVGGDHHGLGEHD